MAQTRWCENSRQYWIGTVSVTGNAMRIVLVKSTHLMILGDVRDKLQVHVVFEVEYTDSNRAEGSAQHESLQNAPGLDVASESTG